MDTSKTCKTRKRRKTRLPLWLVRPLLTFRRSACFDRAEELQADVRMMALRSGLGGPGPAVWFTAARGTLSARASSADAAVEYFGPWEDSTQSALWVLSSLLDDCEGTCTFTVMRWARRSSRSTVGPCDVTNGCAVGASWKKRMANTVAGTVIVAAMAAM